MSPAKLRKKAFKWLVALLYTEDISIVLPELNAWLREDQAHRAAFACARRTWRLAGPYLRATEHGAGHAEFRAFMDALEEDDFANSLVDRLVTST
jgi:ferric-dicitrate binding protein FerR (iron transport regulator)